MQSFDNSTDAVCEAAENLMLPFFAGLNNLVTPLLSDLIVLSAETGPYALGIALFLLSTYLLTSRGLSSTSNLYMLLLTITMFSVSTTHYAITLSSPIRRYSQWDQFMDKQNHLYTGVMCLISTGNLTGITENFKRSDVSAITSTDNRSTLAIQTYISVINYIASDCVALWRAWVLWNRDRRLLVLSVILILVVTVFVVIGAESTLEAHTVDSNASLSVLGQIAVWLPSFFTSITATALIAYKNWTHRSSIIRFADQSKVGSRTGAILALIIECGVVYCLIWIAYICSQALTTGICSTTACGYFSQAMPAVLVQVSGLYPTAIVVLVSVRMTAWDMTYGQDSATQAMEFALVQSSMSTSYIPSSVARSAPMSQI